jgi:tight adherence protein B
VTLGAALGLLACYGALAAAAVFVCGPRTHRLPPERLMPGAVPSTSSLSTATERVFELVDSRLSRDGRRAARAETLARAGVSLRPGDYLILVGAAMVTAAAVGLLLSGFLLALFLAVLAPVIAGFTLKVLTGRRQSAFADQLDDSVQLLASSLRAGHSLLRGMDAVSREAESPTAEEFARVVNETRVGRDLGKALEDVSERMGSEDFSWIAQAIAIHREVGGALAEVLDQVGTTIRERNQIRRQVKALSAEGKLSAYVLMALPFGVTGFLTLTNPEYLAKFTQSPLGYALIGVCVIQMVVGALWLRKVVSFKF